jgi:nitronate monooxygenase
MQSKLPLHISNDLKLPVIAAPMFLVSSPALVVAACREGIIGSFPALNARTTDILDEWMKQITDEIASLRVTEPSKRIAPWAVNIILHRTNKRLQADRELIKKYEPPIVITSLGNPSLMVETVHDYGGLAFSDVSTITHAKKAAEAGVDGLILVCAGAGGHAGTINSFAFVEAVREFWDGIIVLAGGISTGQAILACQILGVDLVYMGTPFIAALESLADEEYKNMLIESSVEDIIYTDAFSGVNGNYLKPSIVKAGLDPENLKQKANMDFSKSGKPKAWKDIWSAGQGVGKIKEIKPVAQIIGDLRYEYKRAADERPPWQ